VSESLPMPRERMTVAVAEDEPPAPRHARALSTTGLVLLALVVGLALWLRGQPSFVAWQVAHDHARCFGRAHLRPRLWSEDPADVRQWLEARGTPVQPLPARAGSVGLVGVRYCALHDRVAAHVFYGGGQSLVSVFVLSGPARFRDGWAGEIDTLQVRLVRSAGRTVAVVGEVEEDVDAVAHAFRVSEA
jgi:hypothetical protein